MHVDRRGRRRGLGRVQRARGARPTPTSTPTAPGRCSATSWCRRALAARAARPSVRRATRWPSAALSRRPSSTCGCGARAGRWRVAATAAPPGRRSGVDRGARHAALDRRAGRAAAAVAEPAATGAVKLKIAPGPGRRAAVGRLVAGLPGAAARRRRQRQLLDGCEAPARRRWPSASRRRSTGPARPLASYLEQPLPADDLRRRTPSWRPTLAVPVALDESIDSAGRRGDGVGPWAPPTLVNVKPARLGGSAPAALGRWSGRPASSAGVGGASSAACSRPASAGRPRCAVGAALGLDRHRPRAQSAGTSTTTSPSRSSWAPTA